MKLTRRQVEFKPNLIDLNDEFSGPIHYSILAERLEVNPCTPRTCYAFWKRRETSYLNTSSPRINADLAEKSVFNILSLLHGSALQNVINWRDP